MPIFEYKCYACRQEFEYISYKTDDDGPAMCPCGSNDFHRIMSAGHIVMGDEWSSLRRNTGCKGFECTMPDGTKVPMYNKNKLD